jgi:multiple sugar transport system substrate-binding protein
LFIHKKMEVIQMTKRGLFILTLMMMFIFMMGCRSDDNGNSNTNANDSETNTISADNTSKSSDSTNEKLAESDKPRDPVTLKINSDADDASFERDWKIPIESKFPHITLEKIHAAEIHIEEQVAQGNIPDIVQARNHEHVSFLEQRGLTMDMRDLIKQHGFDLNRLDPSMLQRAKNFGTDGSIPTLPYERGVHAMYYNKDIFDKFAVPYPTDGMTWNEVIALAETLSREDGGVNYRGLDLDVPNMAFSQLNTNYAHPETGDPLYDKEPAFQKYYNMLYKVWSIPGNLYGDDPAELIHSFGGKFAVEQNVAMIPLWNMTGWLATAEKETGMRWDMVTYPVWDDLPGVDPMAQGPVIGVSPTSEHKDDAFMVIAYLLSDEYQTAQSKKGKPSVLASQKVHEQFAADEPLLKDKNLMAFFKHSPATGAESYHQFEHIVENTSWDMQNEFARLTRDTDTHLRELQEMAEERVKNERRMQ